jgi:hypothetical protein
LPGIKSRRTLDTRVRNIEELSIIKVLRSNSDTSNIPLSSRKAARFISSDVELREIGLTFVRRC